MWGKEIYGTDGSDRAPKELRSTSCDFKQGPPAAVRGSEHQPPSVRGHRRTASVKTELKNKQTNDSTDQKIFRRTVNVRVTRDIKMLGKIRGENEKCF